MATWMLYAAVVALLIGAAAWAVERATRAYALSVRWIWAAALVASSAIPLLGLLPRSDALDPQASTFELSAAPATAVGQESSVPVRDSDAVEARRWIRPRLPASPPLPAELDPLAKGGWLLLSLLLGAGLLQAFRALARARREWRKEHLDGREVLVSDALGPALVGVVRPAIVMPRWALRLPAAERELMLAHEEEHRRAGDAPLLLAAALFLVLLPWNVPLWWQLRRLRLAVEVDCDRRVLRRTGELRRYANLLLEIGRRRTALPFSIALAEPASFLERRIRTMTTRPKPRYVRILGLLLTAGLLVAAAGGVERPVVEQMDHPGTTTTAAATSNVTGGAAVTTDPQVVIPETAVVAPAAADERTGSDLAPEEAAVPQPSEQPSSDSPATAQPSDAVPQVAQIRGRVTDLATGQPLADAQLYLVGTNLAAISSNTGTYVLGNVPAGTHEMRVERVGYTPLSRHVALTDGATLETDFGMLAVVSAPVNAGAVARQGAGRITGRVVDANSNPVRDVQVYLVGANLGAITRQNGAYVLLSVPPGTYVLRAQRLGLTPVEREITVEAGGTIEVNFEVNVPNPPRDSSIIRTFGEDRKPIIYIDGVRVSPPPGGGEALGELRPDDIERIEVIKGSAATQRFGEEAVAGVILIYRKKPQPSSSADAIPPLDPTSFEYLRRLGFLGS